MLLAYSFSILNENSKNTLIHHIKTQLNEVSIPYQIKETSSIEIWISYQEDLDITLQICQKINDLYKDSQLQIKKINYLKKFIKNISFSSYGLVTLTILCLSLFISLQINILKPQESFIKSLLFEKNSSDWIGMYNYILLKKSYLQIFKNSTINLFYLKNIWYFFIPSLIHLSLLGTFFNCFWFALLGNSIEIKIGKIKFLALIIILGLLTNFFQYVMTGPTFFGLSGIICGLTSFILVRKKNFPWEAYTIQKETLFFIIFCAAASFILQSIITLAQISEKPVPYLQIPNTSLLSGLLIGYLLGKTKFMKIKEA